jgi:hypothetical protein
MTIHTPHPPSHAGVGSTVDKGAELSGRFPPLVLDISLLFSALPLVSSTGEGECVHFHGYSFGVADHARAL